MMSACVHRDVQLVGELLQQHCGCGPGGEPDGLSSGERAADAAEPSRGALPQRLEVPVLQPAAGWQPGRVPAGLTLRTLLFNKARRVVDEHPACSCHLNFLFCAVRTNTVYFIAVSSLPSCLYIIAIFLHSVMFWLFSYLSWGARELALYNWFHAWCILYIFLINVCAELWQN